MTNDPQPSRRLTLVEYTKLRSAGYTDAEIKADNLTLPMEQARDVTAQLPKSQQTPAEKGLHDSIRDLGGMIPSVIQGATFGLANDVLPSGFDAALQEFEQRKPGLAQVGEGVGSVIGPGGLSVKALKAVRPTSMAGQVATSAGIGAMDSFLAAYGNAEGDPRGRLKAAVDALPKGAVTGGAFGAIPGMTVKAIQSKANIRQHVALGRTAVRAMNGLKPRSGDIMVLLQSTPAEELNVLLQKVKGTPAPPLDPTDFLGQRRLGTSGALGTSVTPLPPKATPAVSQEALARKQYGPSEATLAKRAEHRQRMATSYRQRVGEQSGTVNKELYEAITSDPENLEALLLLSLQRLKEGKGVGSILPKTPPP